MCLCFFVFHSCWLFIWQGTALISYRQKCDRLLMCNLQSLEVFSCSLAAEEETALSIIDPMSLSIELNKVQDQPSSSAGLLDAACYEDRPPILEVGLYRWCGIVNDLVVTHKLFNSYSWSWILLSDWQGMTCSPVEVHTGQEQSYKLERQPIPMNYTAWQPYLNIHFIYGIWTSDGKVRG